jgi:DNA-binding response OmpR family regulator
MSDLCKPEEMEKKRQQILVIEDDEPLAHLLKLHLETEGYTVHTETRGSRGLNYAAENPLDLVILDLRLPDVSGFQVCKELRRIHRPWNLPILMLTALNEPVDQLRGFAHGADAYLTKPYEPDELMQTIRLLI